MVFDGIRWYSTSTHIVFNGSNILLQQNVLTTPWLEPGKTYLMLLFVALFQTRQMAEHPVGGYPALHLITSFDVRRDDDALLVWETVIMETQHRRERNAKTRRNDTPIYFKPRNQKMKRKKTQRYLSVGHENSKNDPRTNTRDKETS